MLPPKSGQPQIGPWPFIATVLAQEPDDHALTVLLRSGQVLTTVRVVTHGPNDALRVRLAPLPGLGTDGLVVFPHGDMRNGVWMGSIAKNQTDAIHTGPGDQFATYEADHSGGWRLRDGSGRFAEQWPDGSSMLVGQTTLPTTFRHVLDATKARVRSVLTWGQRIASHAAPMAFSLSHASGAAVAISAAGSVAANCAAGQTVTLTGNGSVVAINADGSITLGASDAIVTVNGNLQVSGNVTAAYTGAAVDLLTHVHGGVQNGSGVTSGPSG